MKNKSFTLIELLVVIVIIGILAGVIIVSVSSSINKASFAKAQSFSNTVQNELLGDLVSEWTFDNASNPGEDTWGNNDGTNYGATYEPKADGECVYGGCYSFDGVNDYISTESSNDFNFGTGDFTYSFWFKVINKTLTQIIVRSLYESSDGGGAYVQNNSFYGYSRTNTTSWVGLSSNKIENNTWNYAVSIRKSQVVYVYLNGTNISPTGATGANFDCVGHIKTTIGVHPTTTTPSQFFGGLIDDVRIYDAALSSAQIKQEYVAGLDSLLANNNISKEEYDQRLNSLARAD